MIKLAKYLKPFTLSILLAVVLLFVQAQCDLALPDYLSNIVNTGIASSGVEHVAPDAITKQSYDKLSLFMDEQDKQMFLQQYVLKDQNSSDYDKLLKSYPILETESIYILSATDKEIIQKLNEALAEPMIIVQAILENKTGEQGGSNMLAQLPAGQDPFLVLSQLPPEQIAQIKAEISASMEEMPSSSKESAAKLFVKAEYIYIGMDVASRQTAYILKAGGAMLGIAFLGMLASVIVSYLASRIAAGFSRNLRGQVFRKVESFSSAEFNKFSTASLITRTTNDIQQIQMIIVMILRMVIYAPIIGIGALIKVVNTNVSMTWIIGLAIVVIITVIGTSFVFAMPKFTRVQKLVDRLNLVMREFLTGMPVIRAFNTERQEEEKFDKVNRDITKVNLFVNRLMALMMPIINLTMNCVSVLIVWVAAKQIEAGSMQIGDMLAFMQYAMQTIVSFLMISVVSIMLPRAAISGKRISEVLDIKLEINDPLSPSSFVAGKQGLVEFDHVSFRYPGAEADVLHDITFQAKPGETTAFIGSTGSGKSTIINLIPRFFDVTQGEIRVNGIDIRKVSQHTLRECIGFVPQKGVLFSGTIASNLRYANASASDEDIWEAAEIAQAKDFITDKPRGLDEAISQGGTNVSGGQKQRLSIARALVRQPDIFIFDDTFSALDFKTDAALRKALNEMTAKTKKTVFIVAQRISTIMHAEQIIVLDQGKIVGIGTHDALMKSCNIYEEIAYSQLSKEELSHE